MDEKLYKIVRSTAITSLVIGIGTLAFGVAAGVLLIVHGARLMVQRSKIIL